MRCSRSAGTPLLDAGAALSHPRQRPLTDQWRGSLTNVGISTPNSGADWTFTSEPGIPAARVGAYADARFFVNGHPVRRFAAATRSVDSYVLEMNISPGFSATSSPCDFEVRCNGDLPRPSRGGSLTTARCIGRAAPRCAATVVVIVGASGRSPCPQHGDVHADSRRSMRTVRASHTAGLMSPDVAPSTGLTGALALDSTQRASSHSPGLAPGSMGICEVREPIGRVLRPRQSRRTWCHAWRRTSRWPERDVGHAFDFGGCRRGRIVGYRSPMPFWVETAAQTVSRRATCRSSPSRPAEALRLDGAVPDHTAVPSGDAAARLDRADTPGTCLINAYTHDSYVAFTCERHRGSTDTGARAPGARKPLGRIQRRLGWRAGNTCNWPH
jgi:hypothetical protein